MKPYESDVVNLHAQLTGYQKAVERFEAASKGQHPVAAYHPLFEALNWAASIDHRIGEIWIPHGIAHRPGKNWPTTVGNAEVVPAFRWVRNTLHHDWADALDLDRSGFTFPKTFPLVFFEWRWRTRDRLPVDARKRGEAAYVEILAGQPARHALRRLGEVFAFVSRLLEPQHQSISE